MTRTTVAIIGAGPSGLTIANLLKQAGIDCVVLECRSRSYVEKRQRSGTVDPRSVQMFERWKLAEKVLEGPSYPGIIEVRMDGQTHQLKESLDDPIGATSLICPQQVLVTNLIAAFLSDSGDLRFEVQNVVLHDLDSDQPSVTYRDAAGEEHRIVCDLIAGCDAEHGVSRASVPEGVLTRHHCDYGISWLAVLADVPLWGSPRLGISGAGFVAQYPRGSAASRFYLECDPSDTTSDWSDERIWDQIQTRLEDPDTTGTVLSKEVLALESTVYEPMSHGRLHLVGDAAHLMSPITGKGMNLALADADVFAQAVRTYVENGDTSGLEGYSDTCLRLVWRHQEFSTWFTEMLHDSGSATRAGTFRRGVARARLDRVTTSPAAARVYGDAMWGAP
ncbi:4-hydroxybenzoate 3-monooxygenase [Streptomyces sp. NPDC006872]|uniref:4-hydroxybenzoate 3-monooxygenase n=1 Tax=Streptomyces sp. NPDC006872 TaxID=3155720 RepID=UPI0033FB82FD